ncbi:pyridoxal-phosphate dependent enzyme [Gilvimarinus sp. SDUM040013]|uniref:Pyridoxal-phosphate dependent enzyme n=1 Tax=Gilvimarinus gilvus TaxID=3058038 RepID=A0ABU4S3R9_9GAMM|nr:pyridoxal-phosphate dependent enzyme [Gilvimarinus sp. SDUM040013]MDO3385553.1 pyridoxal-phosphate dependent enzyme [Gilvimarinus sp. SDUM040013]MDX6851196.1 pyridoxal-phosphate dependent enzyme [Gilvimarinus sp. SDUM040013]
MSALSADAELLDRAMQVRYQPVYLPECTKAGVTVRLRRDDLIDDLAVGNKFYKLFLNIKQAKASGKNRIVTQGGPWSNHILATALVSAQYGLKSKAFIRGAHHRFFSETLKDCISNGMELEFVSTSKYDQLGAQDVQAEDFFVPEGGSNKAGVAGCEYIGRALKALPYKPASVCVAVGTGGTFAGLVKGLNGWCHTVGVPVLKAASGSTKLYGLDSISRYPWSLIWGFHLGGYARKLPRSALDFCRQFEARNSIALDPVYTLKLLWSIERLASLGYWRRGQSVVALHTGGLQGRRGFSDQLDWQEPKSLNASNCYG